MKKILILGIAGLVLGACSMYKTPTEVVPEAMVTPTVEPETVMVPKTINLTAQSGSGQSGQAVFTDLGGGQTRVVVTLIEDSKVPQPVHIHTGSCPTPGAVRYPLTIVVDGKSETVVDAAMSALFGAEAMAVNVHKSVAEASVYVSCGDLR